jgi:hypothetical protein
LNLKIKEIKKKENNSEGKDNEDSRPEATEPLNSSSESDTDEELGTSASVQEEKREFEAGLSDLRHKLAQEVIIEEDDEGKPFFPRFGEKNIIY